MPPPGTHLPVAPVRRLTRPLARFLEIESASGLFLLAAAVIALILANSAAADAYHKFWHTPIVLEIGPFRLAGELGHLIINDVLMTIFFFVVGLEIKRELVAGELRDPRKAALPVIAALGGMLAPAAIFLALHHDKPGDRGWGIPMATDIAFVVGIMALLGRRVPIGLKIMILTLAIADDIGAVIVIADLLQHRSELGSTRTCRAGPRPHLWAQPRRRPRHPGLRRSSASASGSPSSTPASTRR